MKIKIKKLSLKIQIILLHQQKNNDKLQLTYLNYYLALVFIMISAKFYE
jgi:hypothetical protein